LKEIVKIVVPLVIWHKIVKKVSKIAQTMEIKITAPTALSVVGHGFKYQIVSN
jgi:hypothetical protein